MMSLTLSGLLKYALDVLKSFKVFFIMREIVFVFNDSGGRALF